MSAFSGRLFGGPRQPSGGRQGLAAAPGDGPQRAGRGADGKDRRPREPSGGEERTLEKDGGAVTEGLEFFYLFVCLVGWII